MDDRKEEIFTQDLIEKVKQVVESNAKGHSLLVIDD